MIWLCSLIGLVWMTKVAYNASTGKRLLTTTSKLGSECPEVGPYACGDCTVGTTPTSVSVVVSSTGTYTFSTAPSCASSAANCNAIFSGTHVVPQNSEADPCRYWAFNVAGGCWDIKISLSGAGWTCEVGVVLETASGILFSGGVGTVDDPDDCSALNATTGGPTGTSGGCFPGTVDAGMSVSLTANP